MKRILTLLLGLSALSAAAKTTAINIVPMPQSVEVTKGSCKLSGITVNCDPGIGSKAIQMVSAFADQLSMVSGKTSSVATPVGIARSAMNGKVKGLTFIKDASMAAESYRMSINPGMIIVRASDFNGFYYSVQTIKQLLPAAIYGKTPAPNESWKVPCCEISDAPRFAYRGVLLDCGRHFFSVEEVKKFLDVMAAYKLNRLHWHLSEDQGWRIEIKKYPKLTEVGAFRSGTQIGKDRNSSDGIRYGGYYTQDQVKEIIAYADMRGINIIPEIDLPGHMLAALASYPQYGCAGSAPYSVWTRWGISKQVLNVGKEETMLFLEDIVGEVADLFPGEYFNIGGDECPKDEWKTDPDCQAKIKELGLVDDEKATKEQRLQNYVTARMQKFLATKGKKIIGWDEILEGDLAKGATVMSWRGPEGGIKAAKAGYDVIMSPNNYMYLDYTQTEGGVGEPLGQSRCVTLEKVYSFDPYDQLDSEAQKHIIGVQGNLWTEYIATPEHLQYMLLPRMLALAEVQWSRPEDRDYERFLKSVQAKQYSILEAGGYNFKRY